MKTKLITITLAVAWLAPAALFAQQVPLATKPSDVTSAASGVLMHPEYAKVLGRVAYIWGWLLVNQMNRHAAITQAPQLGRLTGVLPAAPRGQIIRF